ncbi:MAG: IS66 family transposase [Patescibacteria group bacterium]|nr:IS66 family transposase [Patescibacteria group bacterium]
MSPPVKDNYEDLRLRCARQEQQILELDAKVRWWEEQHRLALHRQFAASAERTSAVQKALVFNEAEAITDATLLVPEPSVETITYKRRKQKGRREAQIKNLPVETIPYTLPEDEQVCPHCDGPLHAMGEEVRQELKIVPAQVSLVKHVRVKYACRHCQKEETETPIRIASMPVAAFPNSLASPSAVAHIISQKFVEGLPLYRQERAFARQGIALSRQTIANWMLKGADWLETIYDRLHALLLRRDILHADESTLQVLHEPGRAATTNSYLWLYRSGRDGPPTGASAGCSSPTGPIVLFDYQPTRAGEHPKRYLDGFRGYLHADGYSGYDGLTVDRQPDATTSPSGIVLAGCWSHARRGFTEALTALPADVKKSGKKTIADQGLTFCNKLFKIERDLKDATATERHAEREKRSRPLLDDFRKWLDQQAQIVVPKSATGEAVAYCLNQWGKLTTFLKDGRLEIDNNRAERSIKPFVIGRKNWLFANTPRGAKASATIYSIVETAKENGLNPYAYLTYLFEQLPNIDREDQNAVDQLLPWAEQVSARFRVPSKN